MNNFKTGLPAHIPRSDYQSYKSDASNWIPSLAEICGRHGIFSPSLAPIAEGSNLVAVVNQNLIIKAFPPFLRFQWESERLALKQLSKKLSISTPQLLYEGEKDGWSYLIMTKLEGESLKQVWPKTSEEQKLSVLHQIGRLIAEVHQVDSSPLAGLGPQWSEFILKQRHQAVARHTQLNLSQNLVDGMEAYLNKNYGLIPNKFKPAILTGEYTPENILVNQNESGILITGLIDFGDVMVGFPEYDLLGPGTFLAAGKKDRLNSLLTGYGLDKNEINSELQKKLMSLLLLHRYSNLPIQICIEDWENHILTLEELEKTVWSFN